MSLAEKIVMSLASALPVRATHALAGSPLVLPYYHMVSDESLPHVAPLYRYRTIGEFKADVDFFLKYFQPVDLPDLVAHVKQGMPLPRRPFFLTFDDGFREMAEIVAPILMAKGVSAAFFVNSAFVNNRQLCFHQKRALLISAEAAGLTPAIVAKLKSLLNKNGLAGDNLGSMLATVPYAQRGLMDEAAVICGVDFQSFLVQQKPYLGADQIRGLLRDGFAVGGHSVDHPFYGDLGLDEQLRQTRESVEFVRKEFGASARAFAFPHSDSGVSRAFFQRSKAEGMFDISFGTGGLLRDACPGHFQRFSMEHTSAAPWQILAWQLVRCAGSRTVRREEAPSPVAKGETQAAAS